MRYLTRLLRAALENQIESSDPCFPRFYQLSNRTIKIGNDNPDNTYHNCNISGDHDYRITGTQEPSPTSASARRRGPTKRTGRCGPRAAR